jgi:hypothetical protein
MSSLFSQFNHILVPTYIDMQTAEQKPIFNIIPDLGL